MTSIAVQPQLSIEFDLPWVHNQRDRREFRRWLTILLVLTLAIGIGVPFVSLPERERADLEELPPQLARIKLKKPEVKIPPPPPPVIEDKPEPVPEPEVKEKAPEPEPRVEAPKPEPVQAAREKAKTSGLLAFSDAFADMRQAVDVSKLTQTTAIASGAGDAASIDRSLLTSKTGTRSAGVNVAAMSRETGGVALSGRETTRVETPVEQSGSGRQRVAQTPPSGERSIEEVRRVFDANKGAIFAIYNRALRKNPGLQGKVVLELTIAPSGAVTDARVVDSELDDPAVVNKIVNRVRLFDFGAREVGTTKINYPVHFLPS
ncbi:MAG: TonB family protein [Pseudomonadota bacterium]